MKTKKTLKNELANILEIIVLKHENEKWRDNPFTVILHIFNKDHTCPQVFRPANDSGYDETHGFHFKNEDEVRGFIKGLEQIAGIHFVLFHKETTGKITNWFRRSGHLSPHTPIFCMDPETNYRALCELASKFSNNKNEMPHVGNVSLQ
jgi:hypothetical protein